VVHGVLHCLPGVCLPTGAKEALASPSNVLHAGDCTLQTGMSHAADIGIQRLLHTRQNPVKQDKIVHLRSNMHSTMTPCVADRSTNRKKKSQSYVDRGMHCMVSPLVHLLFLAPLAFSFFVFAFAMEMPTTQTAMMVDIVKWCALLTST